jgi:endonuclease/exonuclease/phosphatase family metal-dependent hydrolase
MLDVRSRVAAVLFAGTGLAAGSLVAASPAAARPDHPYIAIPVARVVGATANSLRVAAHAHNATQYRFWASTRKSDVYFGAITSSHSTTPRSAVSGSTMSLSGLPYTKQPYWFRVEAINGKHTRYSPIYEAGVRPTVPVNVSVGQNHGQQFLTWGDNAAGEVVEQSSNSSFSSGVKTFHVRSEESSFTPTSLARGRTYWFRVRSDNFGTTSPWSSPVAMSRSSNAQTVTAMTFNILEASADGQSEGGQRVAPWSKRRLVAAHLIREGHADVVAIQEGAPFVAHHQRQAYNLARALNGAYGVAHTEIAPGHPHWMRTGCYILYRKAAFRTVGSGNHWTLPPSNNKRFAAYQILQSRTSGARFLFVAPHLEVGRGRGYDQERATETQDLIQKASAYASRHGNLPIVYAGDFNSHHPNATISYDGPANVMRSHHDSDTANVAKSVQGARWDSANLYKRRPPATHASIDHIYVSSGVGVYNWHEVINLSHGRFVGVMASDHNPVVAKVAIPY